VMQARQSGQGCVVDAAIVDVVAMLGGLAQWIAGSGGLGGPQPSVFHDSPFYDVYRCADGGFITLGAIEPQFYAQLIQALGLDGVDPRAQFDTAAWPALKQRLRELFLTQPRQHWCDLLEGTDACFAPVLTLAQAARHPHNVSRGLYTTTPTGAVRTGAAPRFTPLQKAHTHD
jgi:alpha-methylacyl-CoA racemase